MALDQHLQFCRGLRIFDLETAGQRAEGRDLDVMRRIVQRLEEEIAADADRPMPKILDAVAASPDADAAESAALLAELVRVTPQDRPIPENDLCGSLAFQALTWLIRTRPKVEHHYHISGNVDPSDLGIRLADDVNLSVDSFARQKLAVDRALTSPDRFLRCVKHVVTNAFADGCAHVELRFNPFHKPYHSDLGGLLAQLHEQLCRWERSASESLGYDHAVRFAFSINRRYGADFANEAIGRLEELLRSPRTSAQLKRRICGWDLSGTESPDYAPRTWKASFARAAELGLSTMVHLGDSTNARFESLDAHLDYVEATLETIGPIERLGHGMVLAPLIESDEGEILDATALRPRVTNLVERLQADKVVIETAPTPSILQPARQSHRVYFWNEFFDKLTVIPVADEVFQFRTTLSQWLATILLLAPEHGPTWQWVDKLRPAGDFLRPI